MAKITKLCRHKLKACLRRQVNRNNGNIQLNILLARMLEKMEVNDRRDV